MIPMAAPVKNAMYKASSAPKGPSTNPISKANFTSPKPIPLPLVSKNIAKKNPAARIAEVILDSSKLLLKNNIHAKLIISVGISILSGMIPCFKSAKKIATNEEPRIK
jgi:hypothetical protein